MSKGVIKQHSFLEEVWLNYKKLFLSFTGVFGFLAGVLGTYVVFFEQDKSRDTYTLILIAMLIAYLTAILVALICSIYAAKKRMLVQNVTLRKRGYIESVEGDYVSTVDMIINRFAEEGVATGDICCVIGLNQIADLKYTSEGSVMEAVLERLSGRKDLDSALKTPIVKEFQKRIKKAVKTLEDDAFEGRCSVTKKKCIRFGTCLAVELPLIYGMDSPENPIALLVMQSHPDFKSGNNSRDRNIISGPKSIDIIPNVFSAVEELKISHLIMPALGTCRLGNSTQSVIGSIVLRYLSTLQSAVRPFNMTITLRKSDLDRSGASLSQIKRYVRDAAALFK